MGRPSSFTAEIAEEICERIATQPRGIDRICDEDADMPCARTVHRWLNEQEDFCQSYLRAKERQADLLFDQALQIADTPQLGRIVKTKPAKGGDAAADVAATVEEVTEEDMLGHRKLQVDTRLRMAGKLHPKKYGDKTLVGSDPDNPLPTGFQVTFEKPDAEAG
jgi:hypothetical protein